MSSKAQSTSAILRRGGELSKDLPELMTKAMQRHHVPLAKVAEDARLPRTRVKEFLAGEALPTSYEFRRLGHALPELCYTFDATILVGHNNKPEASATGPDAPERSPMVEVKKPTNPNLSLALLGKATATLALTTNTKDIVDLLKKARDCGLSLDDTIALLEG